MKWETVATVRDEGAVEVARETLADRDIPVEVRREEQNPYVRAGAGWEVRVPVERVTEATRALAHLAAELEAQVTAQAEQPDAPEPTELVERLKPPRLGGPQVVALVVVIAGAAIIFLGLMFRM